MTSFFDSNVPYRPLIDSGHHAQAIDSALTFLDAMRYGCSTRYATEHKGTPFYIMGYAAFASHDYPSASLYFDAAVEADLKYHAGNHNTAALRFIQLLQTASEPLLAQGIIDEIVSSAQTLLTDYGSRALAQPITLDEVRSRFLTKIVVSGVTTQRSLVTAFLSFVGEWPYRARQIKLVEAGSREPFFLHILRGCVLFESLLKAASGTPNSIGQLGKALHHHATALGIKRNKIHTSETDFNNIPASL
ncbi:MAG: hypothetical protein ABSE69_19665, partial [Roseiarcus sp.]